MQVRTATTSISFRGLTHFRRTGVYVVAVVVGLLAHAPPILRRGGEGAAERGRESGPVYNVHATKFLEDPSAL